MSSPNDRSKQKSRNKGIVWGCGDIVEWISSRRWKGTGRAVGRGPVSLGHGESGSHIGWLVCRVVCSVRHETLSDVSFSRPVGARLAISWQEETDYAPLGRLSQQSRSTRLRSGRAEKARAHTFTSHSPYFVMIN